MSEENKDRRAVLKGIAAGSAVIGGSKALPEQWSKPLTDSVLLPAHAVVSATSGDTTFVYGDYAGASSEYDGYPDVGGDAEGYVVEGDIYSDASDDPPADY